MTMQLNMTYTGGKEVVSSNAITTASNAGEHKSKSQYVHS